MPEKNFTNHVKERKLTAIFEYQKPIFSRASEEVGLSLNSARVSLLDARAFSFMTIKNLFPNMDDRGRLSIGRRFIHSYRRVHQSVPPKIKEDQYEVCDYPEEFLNKYKTRIINRFIKKYPHQEAAIRKPKRTRIKAVKVDGNG